MRAPRYLRRFSRTERAVHWVHASAFLVMLGSGIVLYLPDLAAAVGRRPLVKDVHLWTAVAWAGALVLVVALGDRRALRRTLRDLDRTGSDRFNLGQKLNAALTASFALLFAVSGLLLWLGERDTRFRFGSSIVLHDVLAYVSVALLCGHLYLAVLHPATRHALRGMTRGTVREDWAREHHPRWAADAASRRMDT
jgi:formate dehydrogenase subunit gamma